MMKLNGSLTAVQAMRNLNCVPTVRIFPPMLTACAVDCVETKRSVNKQETLFPFE